MPKSDAEALLKHVRNHPKLGSQKPDGSDRASTIHHLKPDQSEPKLDIEAYLAEISKFGQSKWHSLNRAALINRSFYGALILGSENNQEVFSSDSWLFRMHTLGHLDSPTYLAKTPRNLKQYFSGYYQIKSHALTDILLLLKNNPQKETLEEMKKAVSNRISYLIGIDTEETPRFGNRTEYSIESMQIRINKIQKLLKESETKHKNEKINHLIDYTALVVQEGILLSVTLYLICEILNLDQEEIAKIKVYAKKLDQLIQKNNLNLNIIKTTTDEGFYRLKKLKEKIIKPISLENHTIPINLWLFSSILHCKYNLIDDPKNYPDTELEDMYKILESKSASQKLGEILISSLNGKVNDGKIISSLADEVWAIYEQLSVSD